MSLVPVLTTTIGSWASHPDRRCLGQPVEAYYPPGIRNAGRGTANNCTGCPVIAECLSWALEQREPGVWGGTTESDRVAMLRAQRRLAA